MRQPADVTQGRLIGPPVPRAPRPHPVGPRRLPSPQDRSTSGGSRRGRIRIRRHKIEKARRQAELAQRQATEAAAAGFLSPRRPGARVPGSSHTEIVFEENVRSDMEGPLTVCRI